MQVFEAWIEEVVGLLRVGEPPADEGGGEEGSDLKLLHQPLLRLALSLRNNPSARQKRRARHGVIMARSASRAYHRLRPKQSLA